MWKLSRLLPKPKPKRKLQIEIKVVPCPRSSCWGVRRAEPDVNKCLNIFAKFGKKVEPGMRKPSG